MLSPSYSNSSTFTKRANRPQELTKQLKNSEGSGAATTSVGQPKRTGYAVNERSETVLLPKVSRSFCFPFDPMHYGCAEKETIPGCQAQVF
jgi:hypothetical protein